MAGFSLDLSLGGLVSSDVTDAFYPYPKNNLSSQPWTSSSLTGPEASLLSVTKDDDERPGWESAHHWPHDQGRPCPPPEELVRSPCTSFGWRDGRWFSPVTQEVSEGRAGTLANTLIKGLRAFFFNWFIYSWLCWVFGTGFSLVAESGLLTAATSLFAEDELSGSRAQIQQSWCTGPDALLHVGSSLTRDWTHVLH